MLCVELAEPRKRGRETARGAGAVFSRGDLSGRDARCGCGMRLIVTHRLGAEGDYRVAIPDQGFARKARELLEDRRIRNPRDRRPDLVFFDGCGTFRRSMVVLARAMMPSQWFACDFRGRRLRVVVVDSRPGSHRRPFQAAAARFESGADAVDDALALSAECYAVVYEPQLRGTIRRTGAPS